MANFAWHDLSPRKPLYDAGDVRCLDGDLESAQLELASSIAPLLQENQRVVVLGGGHETAWGSFLGLTEAFPDAAIGIINLDAHFDLRPGPITHSGTPFRQIADWHRSRDRRFRYVCLGVANHSTTSAMYRTANDMDVWFKHDFQIDDFIRGLAFEELERDFVREVDLVYLSVDLDVLPGWIMPAVSAPAARGVPPESIEQLIDFIADSSKLALADVVEFNPTYDRDGLAARTAARLVWALAKRWNKTPAVKRS
jgi:formiminoglutamase